MLCWSVTRWAASSPTWSPKPNPDASLGSWWKTRHRRSPVSDPRQRAPLGELLFDWAVVPAIVQETNDPSRRWWKHLPKITAPTLLVGGGPTSHIPQELLVDVARAVPDCTLVTVPAGHDVHESKPDRFADIVLNWLGTERRGPRPTRLGR